tara:strand:- start:416 stop:628 length:213 start_codon:yes stop_codon:yes gene_type:complete
VLLTKSRPKSFGKKSAVLNIVPQQGLRHWHRYEDVSVLIGLFARVAPLNMSVLFTYHNYAQKSIICCSAA